MPPTTDETKSLHSQYCKLSGLDLPYTMPCHYAWELWVAHGFSLTDLEAVISYLKVRIRSGNRQRESLKFSNLIGNTDRFAEDLSVAKSEKRVPKVDAEKESVLVATGRTQSLLSTVKTPAQILAGIKAFEDFQRMAREL